MNTAFATPTADTAAGPLVGERRNRTVTLAGLTFGKSKNGRPQVRFVEVNESGENRILCHEETDDKPLGGESKFETARERTTALLNGLGLLSHDGKKILTAAAVGLPVSVLEEYHEAEDQYPAGWQVSWISPPLDVCHEEAVDW